MFVGAQAICFTTGRGVAHAEKALEILASVELCRGKTFRSFQALVLQHAGRLSGCICILLAWDEDRRELVRQLRSQGLPLQVLVVADEAHAQELAAPSEEDGAGSFHVLEVGKIEAGLRSLGSSVADRFEAREYEAGK
jgi:hypothetical protein